MLNYKKLLQLKKIGALTAIPYSFNSRPWELKTLENIDLTDSFCSNINIQYRGSQILRIIPLINELINDEWITDKARFAFDKLNKWKRVIPLLTRVKQKKIINIKFSWKKIFIHIQMLVKLNQLYKINLIFGPIQSLDNSTLINYLTQTQQKFVLNKAFNKNNDLYLLNNNLLQKIFVFKFKRVVLVFNFHPRIENPILNLRLRKLSFNKNILLGFINSSYNKTILTYHLGNSNFSLFNLWEGRHYFNFILLKFITFNFHKLYLWSQYSHQIVLLINNYLIKFSKFLKKFKIINVESRLTMLNQSILNLQINQTKIKKNYLNYLLNKINYVNKSNFIISQKSHLFKNEKFTHFLPSKTYYEENNSYLNCLGIVQHTNILPNNYTSTKLNTQIIKTFFSFNNSFLNKKELYNFNFKLINLKTPIYKYNKFYLYYKINTTIKKPNYYLFPTETSLLSTPLQECSKYYFLNRYNYLWN